MTDDESRLRTALRQTGATGVCADVLEDAITELLYLRGERARLLERLVSLDMARAMDGHVRHRPCATAALERAHDLLRRRLPREPGEEG